jgi:hypothetical protein
MRNCEHDMLRMTLGFVRACGINPGHGYEVGGVRVTLETVVHGGGCKVMDRSVWIVGAVEKAELFVETPS